MPAAVGVLGEDGALAVSGDEDVVTHLTGGVGDPGDTTTVASVAVMQDHRFRLD